MVSTKHVPNAKSTLLTELRLLGAIAKCIKVDNLINLFQSCIITYIESCLSVFLSQFMWKATS